MWLLDTTTYKLVFFINPPGKYAILSHTWGDGEVIFQDMADLVAAKAKPGWPKVQGTCERSKSDGFDLVWIDNCCIDKSSSAELSESINSMFAWYRQATCCYVFLYDVHPDIDLGGLYNLHGRPLTEALVSACVQFRKCRWFTRGWTLQELLAPSDIIFFNSNWKPIGTKRSLVILLEEITSISRRLLGNSNLIFSAPVGQRMSWAATRKTTRLEDVAYCLLGIFEVNMPLLYGEGPRAFMRLQEAIVSQSTDLSIFAWTQQPDPNDPLPQVMHQFRGIFARSPMEFSRCTSLLAQQPLFQSKREFDITNRGVRMTFHTGARLGPRIVLDLECASGTRPTRILLQKFGDVYVRSLPEQANVSEPPNLAADWRRDRTATAITIPKALPDSESRFMSGCIGRQIVVSYDNIQQMLDQSGDAHLVFVDASSQASRPSLRSRLGKIRMVTRIFPADESSNMMWWHPFDLVHPRHGRVNFAVYCGYCQDYGVAELWCCLVHSLSPLGRGQRLAALAHRFHSTTDFQNHDLVNKMNSELRAHMTSRGYSPGATTGSVHWTEYLGPPHSPSHTEGVFLEISRDLDCDYIDVCYRRGY